MPIRRYGSGCLHCLRVVGSNRQLSGGFFVVLSRVTDSVRSVGFPFPCYSASAAVRRPCCIAVLLHSHKTSPTIELSRGEKRVHGNLSTSSMRTIQGSE